MASSKTLYFDTFSLHAGAQSDPAAGARATPIFKRLPNMDSS